MMRVLRNHWQLFLLFLVVMVFWDGPQMVPLKLLVVFFHEFSHALMTWVTGGEVVAFTVNADISGHVSSRGGARFFILQAGYLGSLLIGAALLLLAVRARWDRWICGGLGVIMACVALWFASVAFSTFFTLASAACLLALALFAPERANDLALRLIGLVSMVSVPRSVWNHTIAFPHINSDARMLSEEFGLPVQVWGGLWLLISAAVIFLTLKRGLRGHGNLGFSLR